MKNKLCFLLLSASVLCNLYLFGNIFDGAISLDHSRMNNDYLSRELVSSLEFIKDTWVGKSDGEVREYAVRRGISIKTEENYIIVDAVAFRVDGYKVVDAVLYSDL